MKENEEMSKMTFWLWTVVNSFISGAVGYSITMCVFYGKLEFIYTAIVCTIVVVLNIVIMAND